MIEMSDNYKRLLDLFPENSKTGFETEALPSIWENKDEFNLLMTKASSNMIELTQLLMEQMMLKQLLENICGVVVNLVTRNLELSTK